MNLRVKQNSPAIGKGSTTVAATVPTDIANVSELQILQWELINILKMDLNIVKIGLLPF
jgi:hypothetical protein